MPSLSSPSRRTTPPRTTPPRSNSIQLDQLEERIVGASGEFFSAPGRGLLSLERTEESASLIKNTPWARIPSFAASRYSILITSGGSGETRLPSSMVDLNHYNDPARYRLKLKTFFRLEQGSEREREREKGRERVLSSLPSPAISYF